MAEQVLRGQTALLMQGVVAAAGGGHSKTVKRGQVSEAPVKEAAVTVVRLLARVQAEQITALLRGRRTVAAGAEGIQ